MEVKTLIQKHFIQNLIVRTSLAQWALKKSGSTSTTCWRLWDTSTSLESFTETLNQTISSITGTTKRKLGSSLFVGLSPFTNGFDSILKLLCNGLLEHRLFLLSVLKVCPGGLWPGTRHSRHPNWAAEGGEAEADAERWRETRQHAAGQSTTSSLFENHHSLNFTTWASTTVHSFTTSLLFIFLLHGFSEGTGQKSTICHCHCLHHHQHLSHKALKGVCVKSILWLSCCFFLCLVTKQGNSALTVFAFDHFSRLVFVYTRTCWTCVKCTGPCLESGTWTAALHLRPPPNRLPVGQRWAHVSRVFAAEMLTVQSYSFLCEK